MLYKMVLTFDSVDDFAKCDHSNTSVFKLLRQSCFVCPAVLAYLNKYRHGEFVFVEGERETFSGPIFLVYWPKGKEL